MLRQAIKKIENTAFSFIGFTGAFIAILLFRFFLETFSSPSPAFPAAPDMGTMVHYLFFFLGVFLSLAIILRIFIKDIGSITKFLLVGFPIIWSAPILDILYSKGGGYAMSYVYPRAGSFLQDFISLGGSSPFGGITPGIRIEILMILIGIFVYALSKTGNILKALGAVVLSYIVLFAWLAFPAIAEFFLTWHVPSSVDLPQYYGLVSLFAQSHLIIDTIRPTMQFSYLYGSSIIFNGGMAILYYIIDFLLITAWFFLYDAKSAWAVIMNARPERILHYFCMIGLGIFVADRMGLVSLQNPIDWFIIGSLFLSFFCAWLFSVGENDIVDLDADRLVHVTRPLVTGSFDLSRANDLNLFFLLWALIGGFVCGYWTFFLVIVFVSLYHIYSTEPLRLKRIPMVATFLIAIASLCAVMAGFYILSSDKIIANFPRSLILIVVIGITLGATIKDIKDGAGDNAQGIMTITSVFGDAIGSRIIGVLFGISFLVAPIVLRSSFLLIPGLIAGICGYSLVTKKTYREWEVFLLYFIYVAVVGSFLLF